MRGDLPIPGSTRAKLLDAALALFSKHPYAAVDVNALAAAASVTTGALYHHFGSKQGLYDVVRLEMERRLGDRIEAASAAADNPVRAAVLAGYDGVFRIGAGLLLTTPTLHDQPDGLAMNLTQVAHDAGQSEPELLGVLLAATLRAALQAGASEAQRARVRTVLASMVS